MRFNLLLYVPALLESLDIEYGVFIQHHLMDDADIELDYFDFNKINSENYALDIVEKNEVTKKIRKDCLVDGFTLNSHYSINLEKGFNRIIRSDEVRQIFICFKSSSKQPVDAFIRVTHDNETHNYHIKDNLIFFRLWAAPEMESISDIDLNIGKINYTSFEYFCENIKEEVNKQWHSILHKQRDISREELFKEEKDSDIATENVEDQTAPVKLENIFAQSEDVSNHVSVMPTPIPSTITSQNNTVVASTKKGTDSFKIIAYILLILGVLSMLGKIFGGN